MLRLFHNGAEQEIRLDENIDRSDLRIAASYRQLALASDCTLAIYDLSPVLLGGIRTETVEKVITPHPILALTSTIDRIIYVYQKEGKDQQLRICCLPPLPCGEQDLSLDSWHINESLHLCSLDDGTIWIGHGRELASLSHQHWSFDSTIKKVASGKEHVLVLLGDGRVFTWGNGLHGALGLGDLEPCPEPKHIESLANGVADIAAGGWHSLALLADGSVMSWGWNYDGSLGFDPSQDDDTFGVFADPTLVTCIPIDIDCRFVSAGARHSAFLGCNDVLWLCGSNKHGQIGDRPSLPVGNGIRVMDEDLRPAQIRPLTGTIRHRLCAGQVCVSIASCVKELIENSLDAQSTRLQLVVNGHGTDLIELVDNGHGIAEHDFEKLGLRYHTSKLSQFEDLDHVNTYGFRGEALSSICIYADVTIVTRHASSSTGTKLIFNGEGQVISRAPYPREIGTTVSIRSLFNRFPVRRTELQSHSKREFAQALNIIQSFAIISRQLQFFQVSSSTDGHPLLTLTPSTSLKDTLRQIFGQKLLDSIIPLVDTEPTNENQAFQLDGFISRPQHGSGRSSADRQYLYVNHRPIDCTPVLRTINEVYRQFNPSQYPLVVLSVDVLDRSTLDINCTPDKRTIFVEHLADLCDQLRTLLNRLFQSSSNVYVPSNKRQQDTAEQTDVPTPPTKQMRIEGFVQKSTPSSGTPVLTISNPLAKFAGPFNSVRSEKSSPSSNLSREDRALFTFAPKSIAKKVVDEEEDRNDALLLHGSPSKKDFFDKIKQLKRRDEPDEESKSPAPIDHDLQSYAPTAERESIKVASYKSCEIRVKFDMTKLKEKYRSMIDKTDVSSAISEHRFNIHIGEDQNDEAEDELRRQIDRADFERMSIIGQFNRGFILVTLVDRSSQLFIVDQHAADEIYNFHRLYDQTTVSRQPLLHPKTIPLDPSRQVLLQQHLDLFQRLGFEIEIDEEEARLDRRCRVLSYPTVSGAQACAFGIDEIDEILSHLTDSSQHSCQEEHYESSRLRKVFASKACRMSIMIGTDLARKRMIDVVRHLAQLAKPWNCPHGRPTIRHVSNLTEATNDFRADDYHSL